LEGALQNLHKKAGIIPRNNALIEDFVKTCLAKGIGKLRATMATTGGPTGRRNPGDRAFCAPHYNLMEFKRENPTFRSGMNRRGCLKRRLAFSSS